MGQIRRFDLITVHTIEEIFIGKTLLLPAHWQKNFHSANRQMQIRKLAHLKGYGCASKGT